MTAQNSRTVTVYTTALCAPCDSLKTYLAQRGIAFSTKDLMMDEDAAEFIEGRGIRSVPVLQVGDDLYFGPSLNRDNLDRVFAI